MHTNHSPDFSDRWNNPDKPKKFKKQLRGEDLIKIPGNLAFQSKNPVRTTNNTISYEQNKGEEDLRSVRSEYDYSN